MRLLRDERFIKAFLQFAFVALLVVVAVTLAQSISAALAANGLQPNFSFLENRAGFDLASANPEYYTPDSNYLSAFKLGLENTVRVIIIGLPASTILGIIVGIMLLSNNFLIRSIAKFAVEILRNTPLLVQLYAIYYIGFLALPPVRNSIEIPGGSPWIVINSQGVIFAQILPSSRFPLFAAIALVGVVLAFLYTRWARQIKEKTGKPIPRRRNAFGIFLAFAIAGYIIASLPPAPETITLEQGEVNVSEAIAANDLTAEQMVSVARTPISVTHPYRAGLRYQNGSTYIATYFALTIGLIVYTAAFIAEIVRAGILAVDKGQLEAARALGLSFERTLSLIILPQALRVIIPPLGNQYLNLAKNSSLAIAISFTDLFQVSMTMINQSNQTVPGFMMIMGAYLTFSLLIATAMNLINAQFQIVSRDTVVSVPWHLRFRNWLNYSVLRRPHVER